MAKWKVVGKIDGQEVARFYDQEYKANDVMRTLNDVFVPFQVVEVPEVEQVQEVRPTSAEQSGSEMPF